MKTLYLILVVVVCVPAHAGFPPTAADEGSGSCSDDEGRFPEATVFLASKGYPPEDFTVLLTWIETSRSGERRLVTGYRVEPTAGGGPFDLYGDEEGTLLSAKDLAILGIQPKQWDLEPVEAQAEIPEPVRSIMAPRPVPVSVAMAVSVVDGLALPPIDLAQVLLEDELQLSTPAKGARRIGVFQEVEPPIRLGGLTASSGSWRPLSDGGILWAVRIYSPEAQGQRIHFQELRLPLGAQVIVYNANNPVEAYGPYEGPNGDRPDLWSATCFSDEVIIECYVPPWADPGDVRVTVDRTIHVYRGLGSIQWQKGTAGACNLDVSCYPEWAETALGVGAIGVIGSPGLLFCTGQLIADTDPTSDIPYFLTAYHCVPGVTSSDNVEIYWLYQTDSCRGVPPSPVNVPRTTGGADFLAGSPNNSQANPGNDFTLLRLRNQPPTGLSYLGWSTQAWSLGTPVTCIHHPRGDFKRIAFGSLTDKGDFADWAPPDRFYEVTWGFDVDTSGEVDAVDVQWVIIGALDLPLTEGIYTDLDGSGATDALDIQTIILVALGLHNGGTTEPGSSGSPLLLRSSQTIIGQLWGGGASCSALLSPDYYGRFELTYPIVRNWLDP